MANSQSASPPTAPTNDALVHVYISKGCLQTFPCKHYVKFDDIDNPSVVYSSIQIKAYFADRPESFDVHGPIHASDIEVADPVFAGTYDMFRRESTASIVETHRREVHNREKREEETERHRIWSVPLEAEPTEYTCCSEFNLSSACENVVDGTMFCILCQQRTHKKTFYRCEHCETFIDSSLFTKPDLRTPWFVTCGHCHKDTKINELRHKTMFVSS